MEEEEYLLLKWGTLKGWNCVSEASQSAAQKYLDFGTCMSVAMQRDTSAQKAALCDLIDAVQGEIINDWSGESYSKEQAKAYVNEYGK